VTDQQFRCVQAEAISSPWTRDKAGRFSALAVNPAAAPWRSERPKTLSAAAKRFGASEAARTWLDPIRDASLGVLNQSEWT
jgi:hypothetical protein